LYGTGRAVSVAVRKWSIYFHLFHKILDRIYRLMCSNVARNQGNNLTPVIVVTDVGFYLEQKNHFCKKIIFAKKSFLQKNHFCKKMIKKIIEKIIEK